MKRDELVRRLVAAGCILLRHGGRHDIWQNPNTGQNNPSRALARLTTL